MRIPRLVQSAIAVLAIVVTLGTSTASADIVVRRDGSKAVDVPAAPPTVAGPSAGDGFDVGDAGVGAAGMLAVALGVAGVLTLRGRHRPMQTAP